MRTLDSLVKKPDAKMAGIDVSSKKIAIAIVSRNGEEWFLHATSAINLPEEMKDKIATMNVAIPNLLKNYDIQHVVISKVFISKTQKRVGCFLISSVPFIAYVYERILRFLTVCPCNGKTSSGIKG